jgi:predicted NBD/HSP70 family sugar kinase
MRALIDRIGVGATQAELSLATGLSRPSVATLLGTFPSVTESRPNTGGGPGSARTGRQAATYDVDPKAAWAAAIDIGRAHLFVAICDLRGAGGEIQSMEDPEPGFDLPTSPLLTLERGAEMLNELLDRSPGYELDGLVGIAVGLPGPVTDNRPRDRVLDWGDRDVADRLREVLRASGDRWRDHAPALGVIVDNDANLSAVGEARWGVAAEASNVLYVKWSTGLGAGLIMDGRLCRGSGGASGEFGHTPVPGDVELGVAECAACGRRCHESAIGFRPLLRERGWDYRHVREAARDRSHTDHRFVAGWIEERAELLGRALVPVVNVLNPEMVVINGILDQSMERLFVRPIMRSLEIHGAMRAAYSDLRIRGGEFTVSAAAHGGLALSLQEFSLPFLLEQ